MERGGAEAGRLFRRVAHGLGYKMVRVPMTAAAAIEKDECLLGIFKILLEF